MQHDAVIVGGSFAGLSAALYVARARRRVCVIDAGLPRNRFAAASHGFFGQDGDDPRAMVARARAQLAAYPGVTFVAGEAVDARVAEGGFVITTATGESVEGARAVLAFGISDVLPDLPGMAERWGRTVLHCPYCHGFEFAGQRLGVLGAGDVARAPHSVAWATADGVTAGVHLHQSLVFEGAMA